MGGLEAKKSILGGLRPPDTSGHPPDTPPDTSLGRAGVLKKSCAPRLTTPQELLLLGGLGRARVVYKSKAFERWRYEKVEAWNKNDIKARGVEQEEYGTVEVWGEREV